MVDSVYIFEKKADNYGRFQGDRLGEIQSDFNMSQVLDGTKDSLTIIVLSYQENAVKPMTILQHINTNTWWVVSHDKVERINNENGYMYRHTLQLLGAVELLNARDLTDCAFNQNSYTISEVVYRLFALSTFEYTISNVETDLNDDLVVNHIKTFQNYTLLTALREFLDEYNHALKLKFITGGSLVEEYYITSCVLEIIPKTGKNYLTSIPDISVFDDVKSIETVDKNSYGTCVVSNADNVVSTKAKTYPSLGGIRLSSTEWQIESENAILRLPSNIFKVNWVKVCDTKMNLDLVSDFSSSVEDEMKAILNNGTPLVYKDIIRVLENFRWKVVNTLTDPTDQQDFYYSFSEVIGSLATKIQQVSMITIYSGNNINAFTGDIIKGTNVPYLAKTLSLPSMGGDSYRTIEDKSARNLLKNPNAGLYFERGKNIIEGFGGLFSKYLATQTMYIVADDGFSTDYQSNQRTVYDYTAPVSGIHFVIWLDARRGSGSQAQPPDSLKNKRIPSYDCQFIVNYIPMGDLKIKVDNEGDRLDMHLYNQNGKLTDSVALSKLLNSYSKEISTTNLTRYKAYYDYTKIPKVGQLVSRNGELYVINNVSYDFYRNDNNSYFINCEFTLSKNVAVKSLAVNPNTNVRDYGIPQNFNVKRKQLYRDFYELTYIEDSNANKKTPYYSTSKIFDYGHDNSAENDFIVQMEIHYENQVNNSNYWYYQLATTCYTLKKMKYIICDFLDNNIIGYSFQNAYSGFDITRLFDPTIQINTPISYTDENGRFKDITLCFLTPDKLDTNIDDYKDFVGESGNTYAIYNVSCFIDSDLYALAENNNDIKITETDYNKDALEVPVFEYACQIDDTTDVLIGDDILADHPNCIYFYTYYQGDNLTPETINALNRVVQTSTDGSTIRGVEMSYDNATKTLSVSLNEGQTFDFVNNTWTNGSDVDVVSGKDYAIFRHAINLETREEERDLLFIAKKVPSDYISGNTFDLKVNYYKP